MTTRADPLRHLEAELRDLEERSLLRIPPPPRPRLRDDSGDDGRSEPPVLLCSNDYLGYAAAPWPERDLRASEMTGAGASRLVAGEHMTHVEVERELASWLGVESALLFSSGYAANVGTLAAVARRGDVILSDALNHASIIDGARLSGAEIVVIPHRDTSAMERALERLSTQRRGPTEASNRGSTAGAAASDQRSPVGAAASDQRSPVGAAASDRGPPAGARAVWVVTESYFSMDGDIPDLGALRALCDAHDAALYVDEAHALGVFGPQGRGLCAEAGVRPDIFVGTFGKALGLQGAFVAGTETLRRYLWNRARSFVFSTGMSPALSACLLRNIRRAIADDASRERVHRISSRLREAMRSAGISLPPDARGPILPWLVGPASGALALSARLRDAGILVQAIRPPTVPPNTARLRITATANLTDREVERACESIQRAAAIWQAQRDPAA